MLLQPGIMDAISLIVLYVVLVKEQATLRWNLQFLNI